MTKKFFSILMVMFVVLISLTNVYATDGMFYMGAYEDIYKLSEQTDVIDLPFINVFANAATYDKDVTHSGISIGTTTIDVNEKLEGMHVLFSSDMVTIKGEVENSFIYANNVVIEGKLTGDTIIFAPTVQILEGATVEKDVIIIANTLDIQGTVNGNVLATVSEKATVSGTISEDLRIIAQDLVLENETINGDIYIETDVDTTNITAKYPNAVVKPLAEEEEQPTIDWMDIFTKGIITVVIYSAICFLLTRKENNVVEIACKKFKGNTVYGIIAAVVLFMLLLVLPILAIVLIIYGLGIVAWPILIAYAALLLLVATTSMLIVGMAIFDAVKAKVGKFKIPVVALIYIVLFALTQITYIATYANMAMYIIALGIVVTMITKKLPEQEKVEENNN